MLELEKGVVIYMDLLKAPWGFLWKTEGILRREMTSQWFNQRPELDGKVKKTLADNKHMEIWDASGFVMNYCRKKGDFCSWCRVSFSLWKSASLAHRRLETPPKPGDACAQNPHELSYCVGPSVFIQSALGQEEWKPCVTLGALPL